MGWVDRNVNNDDVCRIEDIDLNKVDFVLITIRDKEIARDVKEYLIELGVNRERILYQADCSNELYGY